MFLAAHSALAQNNSYLPLAAGNRWELVSPAASKPVVYEVTGQSGSDYTVRWENPWVRNVTYTFRPEGSRILLTAMNPGNGNVNFPEPVVYFQFGREESSWNNFVGNFSVVERGLTIDTPSGTYRDCIHIRYQTKEKSTTDYFLAPGVGFVQLATGPAAYKLRSFRANPPRGGSGPRPRPQAAIEAPPIPPAASPATGPMLVGLEVNVPGDTNQSEYPAWFDKAVNAGSRHVQVSPVWKELEPKAGSYNFGAIDPVFAAAARHKLPVYLNFRVIDTNNSGMPDFLAGRAFDEPKVIDSLRRSLEALASHSRDTVRWVSIGNEVDAWLLQHRSAIPAYARLVDSVRDTIHHAYPGAQITVNFTYAALPELHQALQPLVANCDFYSFTYYPMDSTFRVRDPEQVNGDIAKMLDAAEGRPVFFQEIGYASGSRVNSSEHKQAEFVRDVFASLRANQSRISGASFVWMSDLSTVAVHQLTGYYKQKDDGRFEEFLATLGLFDRHGNPKEAWHVFEREAGALRAAE